MDFQTIIAHFLMLANKDQSGNAIGPDEATVAAQMASIELLLELTGLTEEYRPGLPVSKISAEITQANMGYLDMIKVDMGGLGPDDVPGLTINSDGIAIRPTDYFYVLGISTFSIQDGVPTEQSVDIVNEQKWKARNSTLSFTEKAREYPYCRFRGGIIEFMPKDASIARMSYLRYPNDPFYDYYYDANEVVRYMPPGTSHTLLIDEMYRDGNTTPGAVIPSISVEPEYPKSLFPKFSNILLGYMATDLRDSFLKQVAEMRKEKGK